MRLLTTFVEGDKPQKIVFSNGRRILIFRSRARKVDFLAGGAWRSLGGFLWRMREGELAALHIDFDTIQKSHVYHAAINGLYPGSERSRAFRMRLWIEDLRYRLKRFKKAVAPASVDYPLGSLARQWFEVNPKYKLPSRSKWISLASWSQNPSQRDILPPLLNSSNDHELLSDTQQSSIPSVTSSTTSPVPVMQKGLILQSFPCPPTPAELDNFSSMWTTRFERMCRGEGLDLYLIDQHTADALTRSFALASPLERMRANWNSTAGLSNSPIALWEDTMLWCMYNSQYRALRLLNMTIRDKNLKPPRYIVSDCLTYLARHYLERTRRPDRNVREALWDTMRAYLDDSSISTAEGGQIIEDCIIYWLLQHSNDREAQSLLRLCIASNVSLHIHTLLHFLDRSIEWGTLILSMQILKRIANAGFNLYSDQVQSACVKLLRTHVNNFLQYRVQNKIIRQLLEMGIVPKIAMNNAIILNAGEAGDFETAWQIYQVTKANGLRPDSVTYGVLLKGAKLSGDSFTIDNAIKRVIGEIQKEPSILQDLRLLHDVMAAIALQRAQGSKSAFSFQRMLALYKRYCNLSPLRDLCVCAPAESQLPSEANIKIQQPTYSVLAQMLAHFALTHVGKDLLIEVYNRYHAMVMEGHPLVSRLAQSDFTANAFTMAFGSSPQTLSHCVTVLKHMLDTRIASKSAPNAVPRGQRNGSQSFHASTKTRANVKLIPHGKSRRNFNPQPPTVRTWNILLWAYLNNGQKRAANKVIQTMQDRGIRPDKTSWSILRSGYASMQDVDATVDAVDRMRAAGYEPDTRTLLDLGGLWDQQRLVDILQRVTQHADPVAEPIKKVKKHPVEVVTRELDAERKKQEEAQRYLSGTQYQARVDDKITLSTTAVPGQEAGNEKQDNIVKRETDLMDSNRDPGLDAIIQRLASTAV